jgi:hypothetical protein
MASDPLPLGMNEIRSKKEESYSPRNGLLDTAKEYSFLIYALVVLK